MKPALYVPLRNWNNFQRLAGLIAVLLGAGWLASLGIPAEEPTPIEASFQARMQDSIAEREYHASQNGEGLQAPNRRHNLRTYFEPLGIRVHDRIAAGSPEILRLTLSGVGRGDSIQAVSPGTVSNEGHRVEIRRAGVVEWYENTDAGLEQGFTLGARPPGEGELVFEVAVSGAQAVLSGDRVLFESEKGRRLSYGKLEVVDSQGKLLPASFAVPDHQRLQIAFNDTEAVYPVVIDPLLTEAADSQFESDQAGAQLGQSVAAAGDVNGDGFGDIVVGAPRFDAGQADEGAAFVFLGSAAGLMDASPATAAAQFESNQAGAFMGDSVAGAGDVNGDGYADVIVGATRYDASATNGGAAFIFLGGPSNPGTAATQLESNQSSSVFGDSVASAGDVNRDGYADVIVGASGYTNGDDAEGGAFIFLGSATGIPSGDLTSAAAQFESNQFEAGLGTSVASAGDINGDGYADVIVGAPFYSAGSNFEGAAFIFLGSASGVASGNPSTAATQLESNQANAELGNTVASAGDVNGDGFADVIVGIPFLTSGQSLEGAALIFHGSASGIPDGNPANAAAQIESNQQSAYMGTTVAGAGDVNGDGYSDVIVGAVSYDAGDSDEGAAFVFLGSGTGIADGNPATAWAQLESNQVNARFGTSVAGAGDVNGDGYADIIVGAVRFDAGQTDEGAAFVYLGGAEGVVDGTPATAQGRIEGDQTASQLGISVASAGDVNGDGYDDVIMGAYLYDAGQTDEGAAFIFHGGAAGIAIGDPSMAVTQLESNQSDSGFGLTVAGAGDVNGDGYADVAVAAWEFDSGESDEGAVFLFLGSATGVADGSPATAATQLESDEADSQFGIGLAGAGDVNGDGYADLVVGASRYDVTQVDQGAVFLFHGSPVGIADGNPTTAQSILASGGSSSQFGTRVAGAGDFNGDGYADIIVSVPPALNFAGAVLFYEGSSAGIPSNSTLTALTCIPALAGCGSSLASAGDVNGDGYGDVIIGAFGYNGRGAAFIFHGSASGIASGSEFMAHTWLESDQSGEKFGVSVSGAGDVNGDGFSDVIVGDYFYEVGGSEAAGAAFIFNGSASGIADGGPSSAAAQLLSDQEGALLGISVAGAGDVNGDGYADVIVGSPYYDVGSVNDGAAFVFLGNQDGDGRTVLARQKRGDGLGTLVEPWGGSGEVDRFEVSMVATHPEGRGRAKLEIEACPAGMPFGDAGCTKHIGDSWIDVKASSLGNTLTETMTGLNEGELYRWRARVLHAPFSVNTAGITSPLNPAHGPWRRVGAQATEADIRIVPEPGMLASLILGTGLLAGLRRRRFPLRAAPSAMDQIGG